MSSPTTDPTLSVIIQLPSDLARTINVLAKERGQDRDEFMVGLLQEQLSRSARSIAKVMAPIADDFGVSGMTEEGLNALIEQELLRSR
jgi:hypothetical protein